MASDNAEESQIPELPKTAVGLAHLLDIPLDDLLLPCTFCGRFLSFSEVCEFDDKKLSLIWHNYTVSACCRCCCVATATYEFNEFYEQTVNGREIEQVTGLSILHLDVRCQNCLRFLDNIEKLDICGRNRPFHKVRNWWKGICRHCKYLL
ncbi:E6 [Colobus guereza papillomavirus 2]|uniref:Protein E6 n=2 Tax=Betapapillomavirus TaxID=333922 RepID=F8QPQ7_9PAPI|nr:E6 [Colobus guereza papillomavirus 2]AAB39895.1 oncoprotein [Colobus monkey papillomavirus type 2]ADQ39306.1 E6 [Colobus guereza papillomavirus 2]